MFFKKSKLILLMSSISIASTFMIILPSVVDVVSTQKNFPDNDNGNGEEGSGGAGNKPGGGNDNNQGKPDGDNNNNGENNNNGNGNNNNNGSNAGGDNNNTNIDYNIKYSLPKNVGQSVEDLALAYASPSDRVSTNIEARNRFQKDIENTWLFAGGSDFADSWTINKNRMNFIGLFEENIRWQLTKREGDVSNVYTELGRFTINVSKESQTLKDIINDFDFKVKRIDPKNIVTIVGSEYLNYDTEYDCYYNFEKDLTEFLTKVLSLRNNTTTACVIKRWKLPNPNNDEYINTHNTKVEKLNNIVNKVITLLEEKQPNISKRITVADMSESFLNNNDSSNNYLDNNNNLTPLGNSLLGQTLLKAYLPNENRWTDFLNDKRINHNNIKPLGYSYSGLKNHFDISNVSISKPINYNGINTVDITVTIPDVVDNTKMRYLIEIDELGLKQTDVVSVNNNKLVINNIVYNDVNLINKITNKNYTNDFKLTIFDTNNNPYNKYYGNLDGTKTNPKQLSKAQQKFIAKFINKSQPLVWDFIGDSIEHGAANNLGYDTYPNAVWKSVMYDWNRPDDIFINAGMSGDFTNRATDDYLIQARINKYQPDVVSLNIGINDGVNKTVNGQKTSTTKEEYKVNIKKLVDAMIEANNNVIIVVGTVNPTAKPELKDTPNKYNPCLEELFGDSVNGQYSDNVIYNKEIYNILNSALTTYPYLYSSNLFMSQDLLHVGPNVNLLKAKYFLNALGINVDDSYLGSYQLNQRIPFEGNSTNKLKEIGLIESNNKNVITPNLTDWINIDNPDAGPMLSAQIGQTFLTLTSVENKNFQQFVKTNFDVKQNIYNFGYTPNGSYILSSWSTSKTELSTNAKYYCKPPNSNIVVK